MNDMIGGLEKTSWAFQPTVRLHDGLTATVADCLGKTASAGFGLRAAGGLS